MLKPKIVKLFLEELEITTGTPFLIEGESTPYRLRKDGGVERFKDRTWIDSSYSCLDLIGIADANRINKYTGEIDEYTISLEPKRRRRK